MTDVMTTKKPKKQKAPTLFPVELIDQLLATVQNKDAESILGESGLAGQLKKMLAERMLAAELTHHLANEDEPGKNHRNGTTPKKVLAPGGELHLDVPRDRLSSFEPKLVAKHQRRMPGFDDHVISMYARGTGAGFRVACDELRAHKGLQAHSGAGDSGPPAGAIWDTGIARSDFHHYRRSHRGSHAVAAARAGSNVSDRVFRCFAAEDP
jgi:hypothetical protein